MERPLEKESGSARIKSIAVRGTTSFAPAASFANIASLGCPDPFPAGLVPLSYRRPRSFSLLRGTHRRAYPFFIIGIDHRLLFYNNHRAAAVAPLSAHRRSPFALPEELTALCGGAQGGVRPRGVRRFIAINRRWPVVTSTVRTFLSAHFDCYSVPSGCSVAKLRKDCMSLGLSVGWSIGRSAG